MIYGWHFIPKNRRLRYGDRRVVRVGETLKIKGTPVPCNHGLHASERLVDAIRLARGPVLCRVVLSGKVVASEPKINIGYRRCFKHAATRRRVLWLVDATELFRSLPGYERSRESAYCPPYYLAGHAIISYIKKRLADSGLTYSSYWRDSPEREKIACQALEELNNMLEATAFKLAERRR